MAISQLDLWKLLVQSQLLTQEQCRQLSSQFSESPHSADQRAKSLAGWLLKQKVISKYQAMVLLAGRSGPFLYGDYTVVDRVESGRLEGLFRAVHGGTRHPVMFKFLSGALSPSPQAWGDVCGWIPFTRHPRIARCYEAVDLGKYKCLVCEDLRGQSLAEAIQQAGRIAPLEACRMMQQVAVALSFLHENGRVHGDVRPQNLWLEATGDVKLLLEPDVGTRPFQWQTAANESDGLLRADYAAPELSQVGRRPDALTDIYGLGCSLYELISGQPPFAGGDLQDKLRRHATQPIRSLEPYGVPPALAQLMAYALAKNPAVRLQSAAAVAGQLAPFIGTSEPLVRTLAPVTSAVAYERYLEQKQLAQIGPTAVVLPQNPAAKSSRPAAPTPVVVAPLTPVAKVASATGAVEAIRQRSRARRRNNLIFLAVSVAAVVGAVVLGAMALNRSSLGESAERAERAGDVSAFKAPQKNVAVQVERKSSSLADPAAPDIAEASAPTQETLSADRQPLVADDGHLLWASPTEGAPIDLTFVPPGAQLLLVVRPADLLAVDEGVRVLKALGPRFAAARTAWELAAGVQLDQIEQLIIALYGNDGQLPRATYVVRMKEAIDPDDMQTKWGHPTPAGELAGVYQRGNVGYYLPPDNRHTLVMGPVDPEFRAAAELGWKAPPLRREIGQLIQSSDSSRQVTLLFAPSFLLGDGQELLASEGGRAKEALAWFLGDDLKAGMVSLHLGENFYFEMRMKSDLQIDRFQLATLTRERLAQIPDAIEHYIANLNPHPYWRLVANRYPGMVRFLSQQLRVGIDGNHTAVNAILPLIAAHNLVFGGEMLLDSPPSAAATATAPALVASVPRSVQEVLQTRISLAFAQDSLEFAMQHVANEVKTSLPSLPFEFKIRILGPDLEKDGITRNQQVRDFDQKDQTVADILTAMVRKANPITTVKAPGEMDQKLVWVVGPDPADPASEIVLVTTRAGAEQKKYTLPEVFQPK